MNLEQHPFIEYLERIRDSGDPSRARTILAHLRRGLGREPWEDANVMRYVVPWLPEEQGAWRERPYYVVASLFALHPEAGGVGDMGKHFAAIRRIRQNDEAVERRFSALLNTHEEELAYHLRQAVSLCKANRVAINWHRLFRDLQGWGHPNRWVQRAWARSFWGRTEDAGEQAGETEAEGKSAMR